jgi:hypothetical protein
MDPYTEAHLFVAAIRLLRYRKQSPPAIEDVCSSLELSVESGLATCRRLEKLGIIQISEDPFSIKVSIGDHLAIEKLPRETQEEDGITKELEQFMEKRKDMDRKVEAIQADLQRKKQNLQDDFEARLRKEMEKMQKDGS